MMLCTGSNCSKRNQCARYYQNETRDGMYSIENWYSFGSGSYSDAGCVITHACGEAGNWGMFKPLPSHLIRDDENS